MSFARLCREGRVLLDITQAELAAAVGVSRSHIAGIETGRVDPSVDLAWSISDRLGIDLQFVGRPAIVVDGRRNDIVHARCSAYVARRLRGSGWLVARELEVMSGRAHGWIDLLAYRPSTRTLVVIELKTRIHDVGAIERQIAWYEREVRAIAERLGWPPRQTVSWLLLLASDEVESAILLHGELLRRAFPDRAPAMRRVVEGGLAPAASRGLALIDPTSRRRDWLIACRSDGRRSQAPYRGYADAARRLSGRDVRPASLTRTRSG